MNPLDKNIHRLQFQYPLDLTNFNAKFKKNVKQLNFESKEGDSNSDDEYCEYWQPKTKKRYLCLIKFLFNYLALNKVFLTAKVFHNLE